MPPTQFRLEHAAHHAHTQDEARDPQFIPASARWPSYLLFATGLPFWRFLLGNLSRHARGRFDACDALYLPAGMRHVVTMEARIFLLVYGVAALVSAAIGSAALLIYWVIPRIVAEPWMRLVRMAEHGACPKVADMLRNTRTVRTLAPLRWLAWNMPFHAEHHALPAVPFHSLPALHPFLAAHIAELEPGYVAAHRRILRAQRSSSS
jgi:fatty acid desaturase